MGLVAKFTPGSIRSADDMVRALEIVLIDLFEGVGGSMERDGDTISFVVDGAGGFDISVSPSKSKQETDCGHQGLPGQRHHDH